MGELTDKIKGGVNEAVGKAKQAIGENAPADTQAEADRNARLQGEGAGQELKGKGQGVLGKIKGALGDDI